MAGVSVLATHSVVLSKSEERNVAIASVWSRTFYLNVIHVCVLFSLFWNSEDEFLQR
jgi:hypothetical protein